MCLKKVSMTLALNKTFLAMTAVEEPAAAASLAGQPTRKRLAGRATRKEIFF